MISFIHQASVPGGCPPPPLQHTQQLHWCWERLLLLYQALFLSTDRWPDAGASYCSSELGLHSLFSPGGVSITLPAFFFTSPGAQHFRLPPGSYKGQTQQNCAGIGISLTAGAQQEEISPSAQKGFCKLKLCRQGRGNAHCSGYQHPSAEFSHSQG